MKVAKVTARPKRRKDDDILACILSESSHPVDGCTALQVSRQEWIDRIRAGLTGEMVFSLARKMRVPQKDMAERLHTTPRTVQRHIEQRQNLSPEVSDRLAQLIKVYCRCNEVFKDEEKVSMWLKSPNYALGGVTPFSLMDTMIGIELILDELGRIEHGVFI